MSPPSSTAIADEQAYAEELSPRARRRMGAYFTPAELVELVLDRAGALIPDGADVCVVDPACGAGAFLAAARRRFPQARLFGLELSDEWAAIARQRSGATVLTADALRGGFDALCARIPPGAFELWVGNPPYNGTSAVLEDKAAYARLRALLPGALPRGTSLRDDFAFFLLLAARHLSRRSGALAFVTSATLLDAFLYAPVRRTLLDAMRLVEVLELGQGVFRGTKVRTCVTVWSTVASRRPSYRTRTERGPFAPEQLAPPRTFEPRPPDWVLKAPSEAAEALDAAWREAGEPLNTLVPISLPGLKTRFDELLVDENPSRLLARVDAFLRATDLDAFANAHAIPPRCRTKLVALKAALPGGFDRADEGSIRPFFRYAGARHRGTIPGSARAYCYLDRRLIPRGDHRLRGAYDPHACPVKLVFNTRELPLSAAMLEEPGCVHDHRHARFAPLFVPERIWAEGLSAGRRGELGPLVPNLSVRGRAWAHRLGGPLEAFRAIAAFINSPEVQDVWAPAFGAYRELPVPLALDATGQRSR